VQKWAPAITVGNSFVLKPSPMTPLTSLRMGEILKDVFPAGVFNTISGDDTQPLNVGTHLTAHPDVQKVSFTGSTRTGKKIYEAAGRDLKRVTLELGGNDPAIVRPDVDVNEAAAGIFQAAFANTGQVCAAIKRVFVHEDIYPEFVAAVTAQAKAAVTGDGFSPGTEYGPLNNKMQFDKVRTVPPGRHRMR
jgi:acyl-CoA reductase-like NAD-dependent aldehyde dehydrogenase